MDGNHMLIRWRFIVYGCIDGYSGTVLYLKCVTNNSAEPVLRHFQDAILRFRCQHRIQDGYDTEHIDVARWILNHHGGHTKPFLTGLSVHNQRIERLWLDVRIYVLQQFTNRFRFYENIGVLDPVNEKHLFALLYVYLPLINRTIA